MSLALSRCNRLSKRVQKLRSKKKAFNLNHNLIACAQNMDTAHYAHSPGVSIAGDEKEQVAELLVRKLDQTIAETCKNKGRVSIGIAGGSLPALLQSLPSVMEASTIARLDFVFVDERCVPTDAESSNVHEARKQFLQSLEKKGARAAVIDRAHASNADAQAAAFEYEHQLRSELLGLPQLDDINNLPVLDIALLGVGPDGHICSLFPGDGFNWSNGARAVLPVENAPKDPPSRITLSMPCVNAASTKLVATTGAGKAAAVREAVEQQQSSQLPVAQLRGNVHFILDTASASELQFSNA